RMAQLGGDPDLSEEALAELTAELGVERFERDGGVGWQVGREMARGHAPAAQLALDAVAVPERGLEPAEDVGRHGVPERRDLHQWYSVGSGQARADVQSLAGSLRPSSSPR